MLGQLNPFSDSNIFQTTKTGEKPNIIPGGFAGHCTNQRSLKYEFIRNLKGSIYKFGFRDNGRWCQCGDHCSNPTTLGKGWRAFYDYNF